MADVAEFDNSLIRAVHRLRTVADVRAVTDSCEVRAHPFDYEDLALAPDQQWWHVRTGNWLLGSSGDLGGARWRGITVRSDPEVSLGKPELRWTEVLGG